MSEDSNTPSVPYALVCMVYDEHGNAIDCFPYTPEELERRAKVLRGPVTMKPSPFVTSSSAEVRE